MSDVIIGGHDRMVCQYKKICKSHKCKAKVFTQMSADLDKQIGDPDLCILFTNTVSHKMVRCAVDEAEKKKFKMLLYQESGERDKKEQIHQAQLRFFTNISHDFRTPLSLILAALDKLRREGLKEYYYRILNGNVQRLLNLVNELMDFRTVENGMMKLELEQLDINRMVQEIGNDFADYAKQRNIDFRMIFDKDLTASVYADKNVM